MESALELFAFRAGLSDMSPGELVGTGPALAEPIPGHRVRRIHDRDDRVARGRVEALGTKLRLGSIEKFVRLREVATCLNERKPPCLMPPRHAGPL